MFKFDSHIFPKAENAYIVGGSLRDLLLDRSPSDYDIVVVGDAESIAEVIASNVNGRMIEIGKHDQKIIRVVSDDKFIDISKVDGTSIEKDLERRDFTINAMAYNLASEEIIDLFGGMNDLVEKRIRMVSKMAFRDDPVRLIRAFRIGASLSFEIDPQTISVIGRDSGFIQHSAGERIRDELFKLFPIPGSYQYLSIMADTGLLLDIFPELQPLKGCTQNQHHLYDVFEHTMSVYHYLETMFNDINQAFPETCDNIMSSFGQDRIARLKCAALLHDIGKPVVRTEDQDGDIHFYGHDRRGAEIAKNIYDRLKFSTVERHAIDFIVSNHMRPLLLFLSSGNEIQNRKDLMRFFIKCEDLVPDLLLLGLADRMGKSEKNNTKDDQFTSFVKRIMHSYYADFITKTSASPLITGNDLIDEFGLLPSPQFKMILDFIEQERLLNRIKSKKDALEIVKTFLLHKDDNTDA